MLEIPTRDPRLDLVAQFAVADYNRAVAPEYRLPDLPLGLFVGNTRAMWPHFVAAYQRDPALRAAADPLERWTEAIVGEMAARIAAPTVVRFAHDEPPLRVAMQKLTAVIGLAAAAPSCLAIHPTYGPWFAARAVICVDAPAPPSAAPAHKACDCSATCMPEFRAAMAAADDTPTQAHIADQWKRWLAVRDACPVGRDYRYPEAQILYHYTKDRTAIRYSQAMSRSSASPMAAVSMSSRPASQPRSRNISSVSRLM